MCVCVCVCVCVSPQMVRMLDVIESFVEQQGHKACRLDGSIPWQQRQENINNFNNDPVRVCVCVFVCVHMEPCTHTRRCCTQTHKTWDALTHGWAHSRLLCHLYLYRGIAEPREGP